MRPPMPYFGGKIRLAEPLVELMPPHQHYVEPFCGSLAVLLAKEPARHETVNDLDGDLMTFWRVLRERPEELMRAAALTPHSRAEHAAASDFPADLDDLERARRVWVQLTQGRAGLRRRSGWRHVQDPRTTPTAVPGYLDGYVARMPAAAERLAGVSLESMPALDVIAAYGRHSEVLLYVDPPYLGSTRERGLYVHELADDQQHRDLASALLDCRSAVVLSGYASPLYDELFSSWDRREIQASTGQGGLWQERTEVVWSNRPFPDRGLLALLDEASA